MAKREVVSIECDGPCGGNNAIPHNYDPAWLLSRSDRKIRVVDLCPECADMLAVLWAKGVSRMGERTITKEVRRARKEQVMAEAETMAPAPTTPPPGLTVTPGGALNVGPAPVLPPTFDDEAVEAFADAAALQEASEADEAQRRETAHAHRGEVVEDEAEVVQPLVYPFGGAVNG
jgi:hypothetical protein